MVTIPGDANPGSKPLGSPVLILGAGFSKAVHQALPITDELGERVRVRLSRRDREKLPRGRFRGGRFEEWLSYLAEDQPHLAEDRAFEDQALLRRVTQAVRDVLSEAQADALRSGGPGWLFELLSVLCISRATVISLNYDNLVECGVATGHWRSTTNAAAPTSYLGITEDDVLDQLPRLADLARLARSRTRSGGCRAARRPRKVLPLTGVPSLSPASGSSSCTARCPGTACEVTPPVRRSNAGTSQGPSVTRSLTTRRKGAAHSPRGSPSSCLQLR